MAATLVTRPPQYMLSRDPIFAVISTNLINVNGRSQQILEVESYNTPGASDGQTIRFEWAGKAVLFTCKTNPDKSGYQLPTKTATNAEWLQSIVAAFHQNELLSAEYDIWTDYVQIFIRFKANVLNSLAIVNNLTGLNLLPAVILYWGPYAQPNLRCILRVETLDNQILSTQEVPHDVADGRATFDIHSAFRGLKTVLPLFGQVIQAANAHRVKYQFRFADKYGNPAKSEGLVLDTQNYVAVIGGSRGDSLGKWAEEEWGIVCHNRPINISVTKNQPQYVYFLHKKMYLDPLSTTGDFSYPIVEVSVKLNNGTSFKCNPMGTQFVEYALDDMNYFSTGYTQLGIDEQLVINNIPSKFYVTQYTFTLKIQAQNVGDVNKIFFQATYNIDQRCSENELYLLCETNLGGLETLRVAAYHIQETSAERQTIERVRWTDWTPELGDFDDFESRTTTVYRCQTPFSTVAELKRLKQLLVGKIWLADVKNGRWIRVIADSKNIIMPKNQASFGAIEFNFKVASVNLSENDL
jgi:hypothetical protein